jgi:hypothetical protein
MKTPVPTPATTNAIAAKMYVSITAPASSGLRLYDRYVSSERWDLTIPVDQ